MEACQGMHVENFLRQYGWAYKKAYDGCWYTGWHGSNRSYPLVIRRSETFVSFTISPLFKCQADWEEWPELLLTMLQLNAELVGARLAIDEKGAITLQAQIYTSQFQFDVFEQTLGVLGYYADELYEKMMGLFEESGFTEKGGLFLPA